MEGEEFAAARESRWRGKAHRTLLSLCWYTHTHVRQGYKKASAVDQVQSEAHSTCPSNIILKERTRDQSALFSIFPLNKTKKEERKKHFDRVENCHHRHVSPTCILIGCSFRSFGPFANHRTTGNFNIGSSGILRHQSPSRS